MIETTRGKVRHPRNCMPVGTQGAMKGVHWRDVKASGADIVLGNTYHLMLRPGAEEIAALGGLHKFINWPYPILTDSGGFQVMSLASLRKLDDNGVVFRSHLDGATVALTPERAIEIQTLLGSDIVMQLDECIRLPQPRAELERAMGCRFSLGGALQACLRGRPRDGRARPRALRHRRRVATTARTARRERPRAAAASASTATPSAGSRSASYRRW